MRRVLTFSVPVQEETEGVESGNSVVTAIAEEDTVVIGLLVIQN